MKLTHPELYIDTFTYDQTSHVLGSPLEERPITFGWLVYNKERQVWNLLKATGADNDFQRLTALLGPTSHTHNLPTMALPWSEDQAALAGSAADPARPYHFGRLGFYKRTFQGKTGQAKSGQGKGGRGSPASLNAGTLGASLGLMVMSTTALVNPAIAGTILPTGGVVTSGAGSIASTQNGAGLKSPSPPRCLG